MRAATDIWRIVWRAGAPSNRNVWNFAWNKGGEARHTGSNEGWVSMKGLISSQGHRCWVSAAVTLCRYKVAVLFLWRTALVLFLEEHCVSSWCESPVHFSFHGISHEVADLTREKKRRCCHKNLFLMPPWITLGVPFTTIEYWSSNLSLKWLSATRSRQSSRKL